MNRIVKNASWLICGKVIQLILGLIITMMMARYLGPSNYGILNYSISITAFFIPVALLGMNSVLVQEYVSYPDEEETIMGTAMLLSLISGILCIFGVFCFVSIANRGEFETQIVCCLYSVTMLAQGAELIEYWYQAHLMSKYISIVSLLAYLVVSIYKIVLLVYGMSVRFFALSYSIDYATIAIILFLIYCTKWRKRKLKFSKQVAIRIIQKSKFYVISTLMVTLFAQQDKVMIKLMLGDSYVGLYSAAINCATMSGFIFTAIIDSMRPIIYKSRFSNYDQFESNIIYLYSLIIYLSIAQGIVCTLFAKFIINILFGVEYSISIGVLRIIIWYSAFSYIGGIRDIWLLAENKQKYLIYINMLGALINIILNLIFIKIWSINGAALASLVTQIVTNVGLTALIKPIRKNNYLVFKGCMPSNLFNLFKIISVDLLRSKRS